MSLERERAVVLVVDVQEGFRKAVPDFDDVASSVGTLVQGANALGAAGSDEFKTIQGLIK